MKRRQDEAAALRLLLAQRRLYSRAKAWAHLRYLGLGLIAIAAPVLTFLAPSLAVVLGAVAGAWIFISKVWFLSCEHHHSALGAATQEQFDHYVYGMPDGPTRAPCMSPEDISRLVGSNAKTDKGVQSESLLGWYPLDEAMPGSASVAIAQRANLAYSVALLRANAAIWVSIMAVWAVIVVTLGLALELTAWQLLLGVVFPLLPAFYDIYELRAASTAAARDRESLAHDIEQRLMDTQGTVPGYDLLVWQAELFDLRRHSPQVPNLVYRKLRQQNERAMHAAAADLARSVRRDES